MESKNFDQYAAFVLRIGLGTMWIAHGLLKVFVFTLPGTAQFFESAGFAAWMAYPVAFLEIGGGVLLILGVATRLVSLLLLPVLIGALAVHLGNGWLFTNANGGWEYAAFLIVASVAQVLLGDGAFALPIGRRLSRAAAPGT